ncbi:MAG: hypothetical protein Fur0026_03530 [Sideroxydans sp.]
MSTLHPISQQGMLLAQFFVAALVMLGLGLEGLATGQALAIESHQPKEGE